MDYRHLILDNIDNNIIKIIRETGLEYEAIMELYAKYKLESKFVPVLMAGGSYKDILDYKGKLFKYDISDILNYNVSEGVYQLIKTRDRFDVWVKKCEVIHNYNSYVLVRSDKGVNYCILKIDLILRKYKLIKLEDLKHEI